MFEPFSVCSFSRSRDSSVQLDVIQTDKGFVVHRQIKIPHVFSPCCPGPSSLYRTLKKQNARLPEHSLTEKGKIISKIYLQAFCWKCRNKCNALRISVTVSQCFLYLKKIKSRKQLQELAHITKDTRSV